jgi:nicotinamidase-related amidase
MNAMTHTALLVIDIQRGAFDGARCPPIDRAEALVASALSLIDAARDSGTPIIFIQHCDEPGQAFEENTPHWDIHEALTPRSGDTVVRKRESSAFEGTELGSTLERLGARQLVLCGLQSEFCVRNTANGALARGFEVLLARDGHSTWPSNGEPSTAISERVNGEMEAAGATLRSTADLARALAAA